MSTIQITRTVPHKKAYALRNGDVQMFIPSVKAASSVRKVGKRKIIKKMPKDGPIGRGRKFVKDGQKGLVKVKSKKMKRVKKVSKVKVTPKRERKTDLSTKRKQSKSVSKPVNSELGKRASLRLKNDKKVKVLIKNLHPSKSLVLKFGKGNVRPSKTLTKPKSTQPQKRAKSIDPKPKQKKPQTKKTETLKLPVPKPTRKAKPKLLTRVKHCHPIPSQLSSSHMQSRVASSSHIPNRMKSIAELQRINRSRQQRIFLLNAQRTQTEGWIFRVIGTTGTIYTTKVSSEVVCSCFDFRSKRKPCKHIYFIVTQIAQNQKILQGFTDQTKISQSAFNELNQNLYKRLKARIQGKKQPDEVIDLKDDKDCVICFTEMNQVDQELQNCKTCKKYFHSSCIKKWRMHNNTCPLCRSEFEGNAEIDPLQKFQDLRI